MTELVLVYCPAFLRGTFFCVYSLSQRIISSYSIYFQRTSSCISMRDVFVSLTYLLTQLVLVSFFVLNFYSGHFFWCNQKFHTFTSHFNHF